MRPPALQALKHNDDDDDDDDDGDGDGGGGDGAEPGCFRQ